MANGGELVRDNDGHMFLGAGAEPLSHRQLSTGHYDVDRPSCILQISVKEEIIGVQSRKEDYSEITAIKG